MVNNDYQAEKPRTTGCHARTGETFFKKLHSQKMETLIGDKSPELRVVMPTGAKYFAKNEAPKDGNLYWGQRP